MTSRRAGLMDMERAGAATAEGACLPLRLWLRRLAALMFCVQALLRLCCELSLPLQDAERLSSVLPSMLY